MKRNDGAAPLAESRQVLVKVAPGEHFVTTRGDILIATVLGSCVSACIRDPAAGVGGMNHFMLPSSESGAWSTDMGSLRFGNFAMERLINEIIKRGGQRSRMEIKVFGGADVLGTSAPIGYRNADFVEWYLRSEGMPLVAQQLRGHSARRLHYDPVSGRARVLEIPMQGRSVPIAAEAAYAAALRAAPEAGEVELFD